MEKVIQKMVSALIVVATAVPTACRWEAPGASARREHDEALARPLLADARRQLEAGDFCGAKATVKTLRKRYPYALNCRKAGILLMDSIELMAARHDTLHDDAGMRVRFYMKKLQHDLAASTTEE